MTIGRLVESPLQSRCLPRSPDTPSRHPARSDQPGRQTRAFRPARIQHLEVDTTNPPLDRGPTSAVPPDARARTTCLCESKPCPGRAHTQTRGSHRPSHTGYLGPRSGPAFGHARRTRDTTLAPRGRAQRHGDPVATPARVDDQVDRPLRTQFVIADLERERNPSKSPHDLAFRADRSTPTVLRHHTEQDSPRTATPSEPDQRARLSSPHRDLRNSWSSPSSLSMQRETPSPVISLVTKSSVPCR